MLSFRGLAAKERERYIYKYMYTHIHMYIYVSVVYTYTPIYLSIHLSMYPCIHPSIYLSIYLSIYMHIDGPEASNVRSFLQNSHDQQLLQDGPRPPNSFVAASGEQSRSSGLSKCRALKTTYRKPVVSGLYMGYFDKIVWSTLGYTGLLFWATWFLHVKQKLGDSTVLFAPGPLVQPILVGCLVSPTRSPSPTSALSRSLSPPFPRLLWGTGFFGVTPNHMGINLTWL